MSNCKKKLKNANCFVKNISVFNKYCFFKNQIGNRDLTLKLFNEICINQEYIFKKVLIQKLKSNFYIIKIFLLLEFLTLNY